MVPSNYTLGVSISNSHGVTPLRKTCLQKKKKKGSERRGLRLIGSAMFGATFKLVARVVLP